MLDACGLLRYTGSREGWYCEKADTHRAVADVVLYPLAAGHGAAGLGAEGHKGRKGGIRARRPGSREYALFPPDATEEEQDELFRRINEGGITVPPELERPVPSRLALPEDPRLAELVKKIGTYKYIQLVYQLRREHGWEEVCEWGGLTVMRAVRPDPVPPPSLKEYAEEMKANRKGLQFTNAVNMGLLVVAPLLLLLCDLDGFAAWAVWEKVLMGLALLTGTCALLYYVLFRRILAAEKWDMPYEECLRRATRLTVLNYAMTTMAALAAVLYPILKLLLRG